MDDSSALHRYRSKHQKGEDLAALEMLKVHLRAVNRQEAQLNYLIESAEQMMNTTFTTKVFENFTKKKDVTAIRENYKNLLNHEARKERDVALATEYTNGLRERNKAAALQLQRRKDEREYWRQMVRALHDTDLARQQTHTGLDHTRRDLKIQIGDTRGELQKRLGLKAALKSEIADLQLQLLEKQSVLKQLQREEAANRGKR